MTFCWSYRPALIPPLKHLAAICHSSPGVGSQAAHSGTPGSPRRWRLRREQTLCASCLVRCCPSLQRARAFPPPRRPGPTSLLRSPPRMSLLQRFSCLLRGGRSSGARFYPLLALRPLLPLRPEAHAARSRRQLKSCGILGKEEKERHLLRTYDPTVASGGFCCGLTT